MSIDILTGFDVLSKQRLARAIFYIWFYLTEEILNICRYNKMENNKNEYVGTGRVHVYVLSFVCKLNSS